MKLHIENFAKIASADIVFDGLTVIAGANNTGKSTIGKVLYSFYRGQSNVDRRIAEERVKTVREAFFNVARVVLSDEECLAVLEGKVEVGSLLREKIRADFLQEGRDADLSRTERAVADMVQNFGRGIQERVDVARSMPANQVAWVILRRVFNCVFHGQYHPLIPSEVNAVVSLRVRNEENRILFRSDFAETSFPTRLFARAYLVNTPDVLGYMNVRDLEHSSHYARLLDKFVYELAVDLVRERKTSVIAEAGLDSKLRPVQERLDAIIGGDFKKDSDGGYVFLERGNATPTKVENLSQGMKALLLLRRMMQKGLLSERDVLVLDEPEVHLHPEWQLVYAHAITVLQRELDLTVLVTTHSPYFLKALQVYSRRERIGDRTRFYLSRANADGGQCAFDECTSDLNLAFKSLYEPFARLM